MKSWSSIARVLAVLGLYAGGAAPAYADGPVLITSPVEKVFVPLGFDDNDNTEVVIYGHFTSTCFKTGPAKATVDYDTMTVTVDAQAYRYTGGCAQVMVPFTQSVKFGQVRAGSYTVVVTNRPEEPSACSAEASGCSTQASCSSKATDCRR